jgi:YidC/Oxa1 family membrane protein insertase
VDRRFLLFLVLSFILLTANALWNARNAPRQPAAGQDGANQLADAKDAGAGDAAGGDADAPELGAEQDAEAPVAEAEGDEGDGAAAGDAAEAAAEPTVPVEFVTLGSVDPDSPYRMLATITNLGAGVRRVELASPRFLDLHDRTGYLGHLEVTIAPGNGLLVNAVGAGTPAAEAGLKVGDVLLEAGVDEMSELSSPAALAEVLDGTKPRTKLRLAIERAGARQELIATLRRRPLDVIRPESENVLMRGAQIPPGFVEPPSFLMTLDQIDVQTLKPEEAELPGVDLTTASWRIVDRAEDAVTFERRVPEYGLTITKRYRLAKVAEGEHENQDFPAYHLTLEVTVANSADAAHKVAYRLQGPNGLPVEGWWYATRTSRSSGVALREVTGRYFGAKPVQQGPSEIASGDAPPFESGAMAYMGVDAQYFASALIPVMKDPAEAWIASAQSIILGPAPDRRTNNARVANVTAQLRSKPLEIEAGQSLTHSYTVFAGPKRPDLLTQYKAANDPAYTLNDFVYYGWFGGVARPMLAILHGFYSVVGNYGIAIVMLTVLVRGAMFPISRGQAKSMAKMQELRPEMERIKERFKGDQQKQAQEMQKLYKKHNVNPLAGCLPMLLQLPVFIGLYRGLSVDIELRQAPLFGTLTRWCSNLAAPDMLFDWSWFMPRVVTDGEAFLIGLGPYLNILPLVTIGLYLWQQHLFMPEATNEQAEMQQKIMKYMMVFMGFLFYKVPSGLCLYFIASSLWGIGERKLVPMPTASLGGATAAGSKSTPSVAIEDKRAASNGRSGSARGGKTKKKR